MPDLAGRPTGSARVGKLLVAVLTSAAVVVVFVWLATSYAVRERQTVVDTWRVALSSMADDRQTAIGHWVAERQGDATVIAHYPTTIYLASQRTGGPTPFPADEGPEAHLRKLLDTTAQAFDYRSIWIVRGDRVLVSSTGSHALGAADLTVARRLAKGEHELGGFVQRADGLAVLFTAPVSIAEAGADGQGIVVLETDPATYLYPLLSAQPFASDSFESVLFAREGDDILFLAPLRQAPSSPPRLQRTLARPWLAAVVALARPPGFGAFVDYHGVPVFAATRRIRNTPWGLVVKVDQREALAGYRSELLSTTITAASIALALVGLVFGIARNARAKARVALARSDARFGLLLDHADDLILYLTLDGRILQANRRARDVYGYSPPELVGMNVRMLRAPETRDGVTDQLARLATGEHLRLDAVHIRKDGTRFPVEIHARAVALDDEPVIVVILRDTTERKAQEAALRESEARFRLLVEQAQDVVYRYRIRPTPGFEYVSPAATALSGYAPDDFYANPGLMVTIVHPDDRAVVAAVVARAQANADVPTEPLAVRWIRRDGMLVWTELRSGGIRDESGAVVAIQGIVRDVSERMKAEQKLRETQEQLSQSQKLEAVGRLAAGVAHDFNNLLTVITGYAELLQHGASSREGAVELEQIRDAADRAAGLTRQLLAFSRQQVLQPRVLNLSTVVDDVAKLLRRVIGEDVQLVTRTNPSLGNVEVDQGQLEQVLMNLALNARDAMPNGGTLSIETTNVDLDEAYAWEHTLTRPGPYVMLAVTDTGVGMDAETRSRIFEPFFTTKPAGQGSGLGLATVYGIVKQSGGYIWVYSEPGQGTTFKIYLPRVASAAEGEVVAPSRARAAGGGETVLVVEDQSMLRGLVKRVLETNGYRVIVTPCGSEAIAAGESLEAPIDLLLTDVVLPDLSGPAVAERLRQDRPDLPVVFMSGYSRDVAEGRTRLTGRTSFLPKPFTPDTLLAKISEMLRR